ncbi:NTP transferase domain-containing protein [Zhongshania sp.]|uniref:nucleotidyltransferase family protein n=1 Tax=Zhongshania sp. TaxID=1971902 RepID=UPI00356AD29F
MSLPILILAAGKSRRFGGADKRFAPLPHGGVLVNALVRRARKAGLDVSVVIDAGDDVSARIDAPCILSANASLGMGHSIADGLAHLRVSSSALGVLILPVDLPLLRIESLLAVAKNQRSDNIVMPVCTGRRGHPVGFGRCFWPQLCELRGDVGAKSVLLDQAEFVEEVIVADSGVYQDADTPEQMAALLLSLKPRLRPE